MSGNLALDFVGTLKWRRSEPVELLSSPADLADWLVEAEVLSDSPAADVETLTQALELREALYQLMFARVTGQQPATGPVSVLNATAADPPPVTSWHPDGIRRDGGVDAGLSAVARAAAELLAGEDPATVKECGDDRCTRIFVDRSRGNRRSWCGMAECGNRVKAANYRARKKAEPAS